MSPRLHSPGALVRAVHTAPPRRPLSSSSPLRGALKPLTQEQRDYLASALRVNQAGELAAVRIYAAQTPLLTRSDPTIGPLMARMHAQEAAHLATFDALLPRLRVRPTALSPVWRAAATALGWGTAMLGREAAMACTEAVETEIGEHYNNQIRTLLEWRAAGNEPDLGGDGGGEQLEDLIQTLRRIRDEELEHLDHAVEHDAHDAKPYWLLTGVIRAGCRGAIWVSERV